MPGMPFNQTVDWRTPTFTIQIWQRNWCMDRVQDQDQNQKLTPTPQRTFLHFQIVEVIVKDRSRFNSVQGNWNCLNGSCKTQWN